MGLFLLQFSLSLHKIFVLGALGSCSSRVMVVGLVNGIPQNLGKETKRVVRQCEEEMTPIYVLTNKNLQEVPCLWRAGAFSWSKPPMGYGSGTPESHHHRRHMNPLGISHIPYPRHLVSQLNLPWSRRMGPASVFAVQIECHLKQPNLEEKQDNRKDVPMES